MTLPSFKNIVVCVLTILAGYLLTGAVYDLIVARTFGQGQLNSLFAGALCLALPSIHSTRGKLLMMVIHLFMVSLFYLFQKEQVMTTLIAAGMILMGCIDFLIFVEDIKSKRKSN